MHIEFGIGLLIETLFTPTIPLCASAQNYGDSAFNLQRHIGFAMIKLNAVSP